MTGQRRETDSMGEVAITEGRLWGAQTQRALGLFAIGSERLPPALISAYALLKKACALSHQHAGRLDAHEAGLIIRVCNEILDGKLDTEFPLPVWISGSGTQFNMNFNEVIANRASELAGEPLGSHRPLHPNDHVNLSQSTNDSFPSAIHIAAALAITRQLLPALLELENGITAKAEAWQDIIKIGRTHMMDATPLTLGQEWSGYAAMLNAGRHELHYALQALYPLTLGGTAVGSGINAAPGFADQTCVHLAAFTGLPFCVTANHYAAQGAHDALGRVSGAIKSIAGSLFKIANDIRLLASGPRCGLGELKLPENEPGSSIMPGKVNPTQCEALSMVALQVMANDMAITLANAGGYLEMNVYKPLIAARLLQSIHLLADASISFNRHLVAGCEPNTTRIAAQLAASLMLVTALTPLTGYDKAAAIAHQAHTSGTTLREAALAHGISAADYDRLVDPRRMIQP
ncbi:class II fumarate hydratase [Craterilacuibacter sp.]|uniref:class II fumarate hydratase n=1 Tax=Craterilacuibacter sp. TaxID=2870909 RepID=UPI003F3C24E2